MSVIPSFTVCWQTSLQLPCMLAVVHTAPLPGIFFCGAGVLPFFPDRFPVGLYILFLLFYYILLLYTPFITTFLWILHYTHTTGTYGFIDYWTVVDEWIHTPHSDYSYSSFFPTYYYSGPFTVWIPLWPSLHTHPTTFPSVRSAHLPLVFLHAFTTFRFRSPRCYCTPFRVPAYCFAMFLLVFHLLLVLFFCVLPFHHFRCTPALCIFFRGSFLDLLCGCTFCSVHLFLFLFSMDLVLFVLSDVPSAFLVLLVPLCIYMLWLPFWFGLFWFLLFDISLVSLSCTLLSHAHHARILPTPYASFCSVPFLSCTRTFAPFPFSSLVYSPAAPALCAGGITR